MDYVAAAPGDDAARRHRRAAESGRSGAGHPAVREARNITPLFISGPGRDPEINNRENVLLARARIVVSQRGNDDL
jgi:hypothetical protein